MPRSLSRVTTDLVISTISAAATTSLREETSGFNLSISKTAFFGYRAHSCHPCPQFCTVWTDRSHLDSLAEFWLQGPQPSPLSTILYSLTALQIFSSKSTSIMALGVYRTHKIHKMDRAQVFKHEIDKSLLLLVTTTQITSVTSLQLGLDCTHAASKPCAHVQRAARQRTTSFQPSSPASDCIVVVAYRDE